MMHRMQPARVVLAAVLVLASTGACAAAWSVNDPVDTPVGQACPGFSNCSLREAITSAEANPGDDAILISAGTYTLTNGQLTVSQDLSVARVGAGAVTISGNDVSRIFDITGSGTDFALRFLTLTDGRVAGAGSQGGGAIRGASGTTLTIESSTISSSVVIGDSDARGGAISTDGTLVLGRAAASPTGTTITGNSVTATGSGATVMGGGVATSTGALTIGPGTLISNNTASSTAPFVLAGGGGVFAGGDVTATQSTISGNQVSGARGYGGGIVHSLSGTVRLVRSTLSGNSVEATAEGPGPMAVGGGLAAFGGTTVAFDLQFSTVSGNTVTATGTGGPEALGGGLANESAGGSLSATNSTIAGNASSTTIGSTGSGGGLYVAPSVTATLGATILAENTQDGSPSQCRGGGLQSTGYAVLGNVSGCPYTAGTGDVTGVTDAGLTALGDFGGGTQTRMLEPGSPAFNLIPSANALCTNAATDQRGVARPQLGNCDSGAVEARVQAAVVKTSSGAVISGEPLHYNIIVSNPGDVPINPVLQDPAVAGLVKTGVICTACGTPPTVAELEAGFTLPTLAPGANLIVRVDVEVTAAAGASVSNTANVTPDAVLGGTPVSSTDTDVVTAGIAQVSLEKTTAQADYLAGGTIDYAIRVSNAGPNRAQQVVLTDVLPAGTTFAALTAPAGFACTTPAAGSGGTVSCSIARIDVGDHDFALQVNVDAAPPAMLSNTASVASDSGDTLPGDDSDTVALSQRQATLSITKDDGVASVVPGQALTYTIVASNPGAAAVPGARVVDNFPAALTDVQWTCSAAAPSACTASGSGALDQLVDLGAGGSVTFTVQATLAADASGTLANSATVSPPAGVLDPDTGDNTATDTDTIVPVDADLSISKSAGVPTYVPGATVDYTITLDNAGPAPATGVVLTDALPASLRFASLNAPAGWSCTTPAVGASGTISCSIGSFAVGGASFQLQATVDGGAGGVIVNTASVAATSPDPVASNDSDSASVAQQQSDLSVTKSVAQPTFVPGGTLTYTLGIVNAGPDPAIDVTLTDALPPELEFAALTAPAGWSCTTPAVGSTGNIVCTRATLAVSSADFTLVATASASAAGTVTNQASVATGGMDPDASDNVASAAAEGPVLADLSVTNSNAASSVVTGQTVSYVVRVDNAGPGTAPAATLTWTPSTGLAVVSTACSPTPGTCVSAPSPAALAGGAVLPPLAAGAFHELVVTATVQAVSGTVSATAQAAAGTGVTDPDLSDNAAGDTDPVGTGNADLALVMSAAQGSYTLGGPIDYTLALTNAGPDAAVAVTLTDALPPGTTFAALSVPAGFTCTMPAVGATGAVSCSAASMAPGSATFALRVTVDAGTGGALTNSASAASASGDANAANNTGSVTLQGSVTASSAPLTIPAASTWALTLLAGLVLLVGARRGR